MFPTRYLVLGLCGLALLLSVFSLLAFGVGGGALLLFRAACLAAFREIGEAEIPELLHGGLAPAAGEPAAHFSADLCLRHWPDVYRMARARSEDDPLVKPPSPTWPSASTAKSSTR